jgi:hypothetical protein
MKILFRAYFHQKKFQKKLAENLLGLGSGSELFRKSDPDPDPVQNRPDPQHCPKGNNNFMALGEMQNRIPRIGGN